MGGNQMAGITFVNTKGSTTDMNNIHGSRDGVFLEDKARHLELYVNLVF